MAIEKNAIAVFVRTPGLSPIKPKLTAEIGEAKTLEFYKLSIEAIQEVTQTIDAEKHWAVIEEEGTQSPLWSSYEIDFAGPGTRGENIDHIYSLLRPRHEHSIIMQPHCPQIPASYIEDIIQELDTHDFIIAPATNGEIAIFAGKREINRSVWTNVDFEAGNTCAHLAEALQQTVPKEDILVLEASYTKTMSVEDLPEMLKEMPNLKSPAQEKLITWTEELLRNHKTAAA